MVDFLNPVYANNFLNFAVPRRYTLKAVLHKAIGPCFIFLRALKLFLFVLK